MARYEHGRGTSSARGYNASWQRIRDRYLSAHPYCVACHKQGRMTLATDVDHVTRRAVLVAKGVRNPDAEHFLQPLCHKHHSAKTAAEIGWASR